MLPIPLFLMSDFEAKSPYEEGDEIIPWDKLAPKKFHNTRIDLDHFHSFLIFLIDRFHRNIYFLH